MKAARWYNAKDIRVENIAEPQVSAGKVKIQVSWAGICGSDLHEYVAGPIFIPVNAPHPVSGEKAPVVMGHEFSGTVVEVGEGVTKVKVGDPVVVEPILACGKCAACLKGKYNICKNLGFYGLCGDGGFAEYAVVEERWVHKMPEGLSMEQGALVEPAAVALHAVRISKLKAGDKAVVFGTGPIGLLVIEALKVAGAAEIYAVELSKSRAAKALELGATAVINPAEEPDVVGKIHELTKGGADVAFEVTGVPAVLQQAVDSTAFEGETIIVSIWEKDPTIKPNNIVLTERSMKGTIAYRDIFPAVMDLMTKGYFPADKLVTKRIKLDDVVAEGFEVLINDKEQIKILVSPN
jgi:(R,R)-butanediol dehydrogenase/meso-butanediol dehydrogenase/diacetyl reductase